MASFATSEAETFVQRVRVALNQYNFKLVKFTSNDIELARRLNGETTGDDECDKVSALGVGWRLKEDKLFFQFSPREAKGVSFTKRECLSLLMSLLDPISLLVPFALPLKLLVHDLVVEGLDWDDPKRCPTKTGT